MNKVQLSFLTDEQLKKRFDFYLLKNDTNQTQFFNNKMKEVVGDKVEE